MGLLGGVFLKTGNKQPHTMHHPPPPSSSSETEETFSKAASKQAHVGTCAAKLQTQDQLSSKASALDSFPLGRFALCAA